MKGSSRIHSGAVVVANSLASATRRRCPCDSLPRERVLEMRQADGVQRSPQRLVIDVATRDRLRNLQILEHRQVFLDAVQMTDVNEILPVFLALPANVAAMPAHFTGRGLEQAAQHPQQAGLAGAVRTRHPQQRARSHGELEPGEQCAFAALAGEIDGIEHRQAL